MSGLSLLKKLGLKEEEAILKEEEELKIRPKQAGLSAEIDGVQGESTTFEPVGAWKVDGPDIPIIKNCRIIKPQIQFCKSSTLSPLQMAICHFHEQFEAHKTNAKLNALKEKASSLDQKIDSLKDEKKNIKETIKTRKELANLLRKFHEIPSDYADAFKLLKLLAQNPSLIAAMRPKYAKYQQEKKNPFELSRLSMTVAKSYSSSLIYPNIFNHDHIDEWGILRETLFDIQSLSIGKDPNSVPGKLWAKFLQHELFPRISKELKYETSDDCANWANFWFEKGLLTEQNLLIFFTNVAKPFLTKNLNVLCKNLKIHSWIELAQTPKLASQFGVIVRIHADEALQKWHPPSPFAYELLQQWPHVLKNSLDFMYHTVAPKLSKALTDGNISYILPWIDILPIPLTASLIADSYIRYYLEEIRQEIKTDIIKAAKTYQMMKSNIPVKFINHPRIVNRLIDVLNILKETNTILRGIKIERDPEPSTVGDLLEDIASTSNFDFMSKGTIDGRAVYSLGPCLFGVLDGILFVQKGQNWIPVFVRDITTIVNQEIQKQQQQEEP